MRKKKMKEEIKTRPFETTDLYLSSALKVYGFKLLDLRSDGKGRGIFVFEDRSDRSRIVRDYFSGSLTGSLKAFSNAWSDLKGLLIEIEKEIRNGKE